MSLYVSSHYKNTPNDLQMLSDAPAHHLFVLLGPIDENSNSLPDIFCVIQVALEGKISEKIINSNLSQGKSPDGDLIPYLIARQFQESKFSSLSGARIVRIATHPDYQKMGYGSRSMELLTKYYEGNIFDLEEENENVENKIKEKEKLKNFENNELSKEILKPREKLPPLLIPLNERKPELLNYIGVSFGLTPNLYNFWKKSDFLPVYIRLTPVRII